MKILLLGGTREARNLSFALKDVDLVTSLAGVTDRPASMGGQLRVGGFGGVAGLTDYLHQNDISHVIDATHAFASRMSDHAVEATQACGLPLLRLLRPAWQIDPAWTCVPDLGAAASALRSGERAFLATGRGSLWAFADREDVWCLVRVIDPSPSEFPLKNGRFLVSRPPFSQADEEATLSEHGIDVLVSRNSGGVGGREKLDAAMALGCRVIMIERPDLAPAQTVVSVADAIGFIEKTWK